MIAMKRLTYWRMIVALGLGLSVGCTDPEQVTSLQRENAALEHDLVRLQRERSDCARELDKANRAASRPAAAERVKPPADEQAKLKAAEDAVSELREMVAALSSERDRMATTQDELSRRLMETEKKLAEQIRQLAQVRKETNDMVAKLMAENERLRREVTKGTTTRQGD